MKNVIILLAVVGMFSFQGCTTSDADYIDTDTISEVFELKNVDFAYNATDGYTIYQTLSPNIFASDVVLIYRLSGTIDSNTPIWQLIPRTLFLNQGELDYDFDFSREDFTIYAGGDYDLSLTPEYLNDQTFRIVIVPGSFSNSLNISNYAEVMSALNLKESQVQKINF